MRPIVFDKTVGWLHPATGRRGVVIAGAHGFEDLCSRRFLTLMARDMAAARLPVLQIDYPGCGDAAGDHTEPGQVAAWVASIASAIDRLMSETGVADVLVVGFRLGALLAPAAIAARNDVAGLALLAPPSSGKAYVREMTGLSRMIDGTLPPYPDAEPFDGIEAAGFRVSAETAADLRMFEWRDRLAVSAKLDLLLMPTQVTPANSDLADRIAAAGGNARIETFDGFSRLMSTPTASEIPQATLDTVVQWAAGLSRSEPTASAPINHEQPGLEGDGYREQPLVLGPAPEICGVLCMPAGTEVSEEVVLILNAGAIPHMGWARGAVDMARTLARQGIASMRADLPGLGQSETPGEKRQFLYDKRGRDDVIRIVDWLQRHGFERVCATGICAGAYQAFHAARRDPRIAHLAMVNPLCFSWNSSYALEMGLSKIRDNARAPLTPGVHQAAEANPTDPVGPSLKSSVSKLGRRMLRRSLEMSKSSLSRLSSAHGSKGGSVERWMRDLTKRGTEVLVVSCEGDLSHEEIARHFGPDGERLGRMSGVTMALIPAADHTLTPLHARVQLTEHVARLLSSTATARANTRSSQLSNIAGDAP
ncbi:pimeloyl-ACP methyl ester carboxylesterase [Mesorhizobium soli]|uniref:alpha/beta fold hydrolase n=1 Tax=Pseudaminobacter soli (ex Li et al. 2025) TaxID=1295366 RepID=UPI002473AE2B|nr:alpha/beta fold hydrolase [Mesorhizobium soli]MDH6230502.1 pimeloyl-ACP methyl ester carboxylesterase [Mesorhizobium soli]